MGGGYATSKRPRLQISAAMDATKALTQLLSAYKRHNSSLGIVNRAQAHTNDSTAEHLRVVNIVQAHTNDSTTQHLGVVNTVQAHTNDSTTQQLLHHLRKMDTHLTRLQIKAENLLQLKVELRKDMDWVVHQFLMPAQGDGDMTCIDIFNIPDACDEDPVNIICTIGRIIGCPLTPKLIRGYYRARVKRKNSNAEPSTRALVINFFKVSTKWDFLRAYRRHITIRIDANTEERKSIKKRSNHLYLRNIVSPHSMANSKDDTYVFIDEHISPFVWRLYRKVSRYCERASVPSLWLNNSKIYVRTGKFNAAIRIKKFSHILILKKLVKKYTKKYSLPPRNKYSPLRYYTP